jgi:hypothetical protein
MSDMAEDRVYADRAADAEAFVAAGVGVVAVSVSGNRIGRFRVDNRGRARDVDAAGDRIVVATDEDVLVATVGGGGVEYEPTGYGPAVAVGFHAGDAVAADSEGRIGRRVDGEWFEIADVDAPVRALDGDLVAAADGVYRADPDGVDFVGLDDARDVAAAGPLVATGEGLYELGNGWVRAVEGAFDAVEADGKAVHAAGDALLAHVDGEWHEAPVELPGTVAGIAHAGGTYLVTEDGTALAHARGGLDDDPETGWRTRALGVGDVGGVAIPLPAAEQ